MPQVQPSNFMPGSPVDALSMAALNTFDAHPTKSGGQIRFCCPRVGCAGKPVNRAYQSLTVDPNTGAWYCQRCNDGGKLLEFWEDRPFIPKAPRQRTIEKLRKEMAIPQRTEPARPAADPAREEKLKDLLAGCEDLAGTRGDAYLKRRGISLETAEAAGVRYHAKWYGRPAVVFCLQDASGSIVAAQGRYIDGGEDPKTRSAGPISAGVFATAGAWEAEHLTVCEAPIDALSLAAAGLPAVALCGITLRPWMRKKLAFKKALLAFDADGAGDAAAAEWRATLNLGTEIKRFRPEGAKDWNAVHAEIGLPGLQEQIGNTVVLQIHQEREAAAWRNWPALMAAIVADTLPAVRCELGRDSDGLRWETDDLRQYARYALKSFAYVDGWGGYLEAEPEERSVFRMELLNKAILRSPDLLPPKEEEWQ